MLYHDPRASPLLTGPREDELTHPADTSRTNLASALRLLSRRGRLSSLTEYGGVPAVHVVSPAVTHLRVLAVGAQDGDVAAEELQRVRRELQSALVVGGGGLELALLRLGLRLQPRRG
jgi:hypothetical protein